jgi:hypothetical protein
MKQKTKENIQNLLSEIVFVIAMVATGFFALWIMSFSIECQYIMVNQSIPYNVILQNEQQCLTYRFFHPVEGILQAFGLA